VICLQIKQGLFYRNIDVVIYVFGNVPRKCKHSFAWK